MRRQRMTRRMLLIISSRSECAKTRLSVLSSTATLNNLNAIWFSVLSLFQYFTFSIRNKFIINNSKVYIYMYVYMYNESEFSFRTFKVIFTRRLWQLYRRSNCWHVQLFIHHLILCNFNMKFFIMCPFRDIYRFRHFFSLRYVMGFITIIK